MTTFFTADNHFGHDKIITYCNRPFANAEEMDEAMIKNWNQAVSPSDIIWIVGDFSFSTVERTLDVLSQLNGIKKLIVGNHDARLAKNDLLLAQFSEVYHGIHETKIGDKSVVMCHYPLMSWNKSYHGSFHLHGHTHGNIKFDNSYRRLDVGVDVHDFKPIEWQDVVDKMATVKFA